MHSAWSMMRRDLKAASVCCQTAETYRVGYIGDVGVDAAGPLQVAIMWNHYLLIFCQVAVQLQHICADIHSAARANTQYTYRLSRKVKHTNINSEIWTLTMQCSAQLQ